MSEPILLPIAPAEVRYIKLGAGGAWEAASLDQGRIYWGTDPSDHAHAIAEDWPAARASYVAAGSLPNTATGWACELREL